METEQLIARYKKAYLEANGTEPNVRYANGWFHISSTVGVGPYRRKQVEGMCQTLEYRKKQEGSDQ